MAKVRSDQTRVKLMNGIVSVISAGSPMVVTPINISSRTNYIRPN